MKSQPYTRILSFGLLAALAAVPSRAAEFRGVQGTVEIQKPGAASWTKARNRMKVNKGDKLRTAAGAKADIGMTGGHKVSLREKTTVRVESVEASDISFQVVVGRLRAYVSKLKGPKKFSVKSPVAVASVRGTVFEMDVAEDNTSRLSVLEGVVGYKDLAGMAEEIQVLKGQSVVVAPGAAPRPPEPLPEEMQQGLAPEKQNQDLAAFDLKADVQREAGLSSYKEFFQANAAEEMKAAQYQEGKTLIDAFGKRVRLEEYIVRPAANQFSFVSLNTREDRFDFTRFDLYAKNALPDDLASVNLFSGSTHDSMTNWVEKTHRLSASGDDYYREWQDGGAPVNMDNGTQRVVFLHWFVEARDGANAPTLLSHWVPDASYLGGAVNATRTRDQADITADFAQDIPSGYNNFGSGTVRPIDSGFTNDQRLAYFTDSGAANAYKNSEGYVRTSVALFDDKTVASSSLSQILNSTKISRLSTYDVPGGTDITVQVDQYYFNDDGTKYTFQQAAALGNSIDGVNFEGVFTSSLLGNRKIDVVISPSIFRKAGLLDN